MMRRQVGGKELASPRNPNLVLTRFTRLPEERDRCLRLWDLDDEEKEEKTGMKEETVMGKLPKRSFSFSLTQLRRTLSSAKVETFRGGERREDTGGWGWKGEEVAEQAEGGSGREGGFLGREDGLGARRVGARAEDEIDRQGHSPSSLHSRFERDFVRKPRRLLEVDETMEEKEDDFMKEKEENFVKEEKERLLPRVIQGQQNNSDDWVWSMTTYII